MVILPSWPMLWDCRYAAPHLAFYFLNLKWSKCMLIFSKAQQCANQVTEKHPELQSKESDIWWAVQIWRLSCTYPSKWWRLSCTYPSNHKQNVNSAQNILPYLKAGEKNSKKYKTNYYIHSLTKNKKCSLEENSKGSEILLAPQKGWQEKKWRKIQTDQY